MGIGDSSASNKTGGTSQSHLGCGVGGGGGAFSCICVCDFSQLNSWIKLTWVYVCVWMH